MRGSGNRTSQRRDTEPFLSISVRTAAQLDFVVGECPTTVLECDDNILRIVKTEVSNETLVVSASEPFVSAGGLKVRIVRPTLRSLHIAGESDATLRRLSVQTFEIRIDGAAGVAADGDTQKLVIEINGAGADVHCFKLIADEVDLKISGIGNARVFSKERLRVKVNGVGNVRYRGNPATVDRQINGVGVVRPD